MIKLLPLFFLFFYRKANFMDNSDFTGSPDVDSHTGDFYTVKKPTVIEIPNLEFPK